MKLTYDEVLNMGLFVHLKGLRALWEQAEAEAEALEELEGDFYRMEEALSEEEVEENREGLENLEDDFYQWRRDAKALEECAQEAYESLMRAEDALEDIAQILNLAEERRRRG